MRLSHLLFGTMLALQSAPALAVTVTNSGGSSGTLLISNNSCTDGVVDSGIELRGCLNSNKSIGVLVQSDGVEVLQFDAGGQARVEAADGAFDFARILFAPEENLGFLELILNIDTSANSSIQFTVSLFSGPDQVFNLAAPPGPGPSGAGSNFYTIKAEINELIKSVALLTPTEVVTKVEQVRIEFAAPGGGPGPGTDVPAPATLALLGAALAGLGLSRARRA
jgi:hypothetical protein